MNYSNKLPLGQGEYGFCFFSATALLSLFLGTIRWFLSGAGSM